MFDSKHFMAHTFLESLHISARESDADAAESILLLSLLKLSSGHFFDRIDREFSSAHLLKTL